jgi:superfamily II DNA or RNA helicase
LTLTTVDWKIKYKSTDDSKYLVENFLKPAYENSKFYLRTSAFFSSSVFDSIGDGIAHFVGNGGEMRLVTNVHFSEEDQEAIEEGQKKYEEIIEEKVNQIIESEFKPPMGKGSMTLTNMLAIGRLKIKVGYKKSSGDLHEKAGIFFDNENQNIGNLELDNKNLIQENLDNLCEIDHVAFSGSMNDSITAVEKNHEKIHVWWSWNESRKDDAKGEVEDFLLHWSNSTKGLNVIDFSEAAKKNMIRNMEYTKKYYQSKREDYDKDDFENDDMGIKLEKDLQEVIIDSRYSYQEEAVNWFISPDKANGSGIYWMATGTGKTFTALKTINELIEQGEIDSVVLNASGRLLQQWQDAIEGNMPDGSTAAPWLGVDYFHTSKKKEMRDFINDSTELGKLIYVSYSFLPDFLDECERKKYDLSRTLLIIDELHNVGSKTNIEKTRLESVESIIAQMNWEKDEYDLSKLEDLAATTATIEKRDQKSVSKYSKFIYKLGLSATPFSDFDDERNKFIQDIFSNKPNDFTKIKNWSNKTLEEKRQERIKILKESDGAFYISLEDGIKKGVLVPFDYEYTTWMPSQETLDERLRVMKLWKRKISLGEAAIGSDRIMMAQVLKSAEEKIDTFEKYLEGISEEKRKRLLHRSLIFVQTKAYAEKVGKLISKYKSNYHTFLTGDYDLHLDRFTKGDIDCLITCHKISEGVSIDDINSIILFAADRQRLETIQRIGRSLRRDRDNPDKIAHIFDFVYQESEADIERKNWLEEISLIRSE